jgi:hypothetical protein
MDNIAVMEKISSKYGEDVGDKKVKIELPATLKREHKLFPIETNPLST